MNYVHDPLQMPATLPVPKNDGACDHLFGMWLPPIELNATDGTQVMLSDLKGIVLIYCYPRTGQPAIDPPNGWDLIPGARGCTPQCCAYRDHFRKLKSIGIDKIYGLSTQNTFYQKEAAKRLNLPFSLLSDDNLNLTRSLELPTFYINGMELIKRLTLICINGRIDKVFYPVFPPNENAAEVMKWWKKNKEIYMKRSA